MVACATGGILISAIRAIRTYTAINSVVLQKERGIINICRINGRKQRFAHENMIETAPTAFITVSGLGPAALGCRRDIKKSSGNISGNGAFGIIGIEITGHHYVGMWRQGSYLIDTPRHHLGDSHTIRTRDTLTVTAAGCMDDKDMQRIASDYTTRNIQYITCSFHAFHRLDT